MANGIIIHWSGISGWIRQSGVSDMTTVQSNDVIFLPEDVTGTPAIGAAVTFTADAATPWLAESVTVT